MSLTTLNGLPGVRGRPSDVVDIESGQCQDSRSTTSDGQPRTPGSPFNVVDGVDELALFLRLMDNAEVEVFTPAIIDPRAAARAAGARRNDDE